MDYSKYPQPDNSQDNGGHVSLREILIPAIIVIIAVLICAMARAEITGPSEIVPGQLARFDSDKEADWLVLPVEYQMGMYIDSNKKTLLLSSMNPGQVYIFASTVGEDNAPMAWGTTLTITDSDIIVTPLPSPDTSIKGIVAKYTSEATQAEKQAIANSFSVVCSGIDNETITTATGARETFRRQWQMESAKLGVGAADKYIEFLDALSVAVKTDDVAQVRKYYGEVVTDLGYVIQGGAK